MDWKDKVNQTLKEAANLAERLHLSVDARKEKPFHCDICGESFEPCIHWFYSKID